jgi:hypothetical protein
MSAQLVVAVGIALVIFVPVAWVILGGVIRDIFDDETGE